MASSRRNDRRDMMMRYFMQMMQQQQQQKAAGEAQVLQEGRAREAQLLKQQQAQAAARAQGQTLNRSVGPQGYMDPSGFRQAIAQGVPPGVTKTFMDTNNPANAIQRVPQFSAKAQEQDLLSNQPGGRPIVPGLGPGTPLSRKSQQLQQHPIDLQAMLKMKAAQGEQQRLRQGSELTRRGAGDKESVNALLGQMLQKQDPRRLPQGTQPRIAGAAARATGGFQPFSQPGQALAEFQRKPGGGRGVLDFQKMKEAQKVKTAGQTTAANLAAKSKAPPTLMNWEKATTALKGRFSEKGPFGFVPLTQAQKKKHSLAQKKLVELKKADNVGPLEAVNIAEEYASHIENRFWEMTKKNPTEREAIERNFKSKYGYIPKIEAR